MMICAQYNSFHSKFVHIFEMYSIIIYSHAFKNIVISIGMYVLYPYLPNNILIHMNGKLINSDKSFDCWYQIWSLYTSIKILFNPFGVCQIKENIEVCV